MYTLIKAFAKNFFKHRSTNLLSVGGLSLGMTIALLLGWWAINETKIKWVSIAIVIAGPLSWYLVSDWLNSFAFRTSLSWWIFALAGLIAIFISLTTVSWQSLLTAKRNPVESLRYE